MTSKPLKGQRIIVTRAASQADGLTQQLEAVGAAVIAVPAITIVPTISSAPLDDALQHIDDYDWLIFTSQNAVPAFTARLDALSISKAALQHLQVAAIGPATAGTLLEAGIRPNFVPTSYVAEALAEELPIAAGQQVLLPRADIARDALRRELTARGAVVDEVTAYRTVPATPSLDEETLAAATAITFTSSSTVRYFLAALDADPQSAASKLAHLSVACIGPITAATAQEMGLHVDIVAEAYTSAGLVTALVAWFSREEASL